jgi:hypothetical protein
VWSVVPLRISRLQTTISWSTATCASVWSHEYLTGFERCCIGIRVQVRRVHRWHQVIPDNPPLPSSSSRRSWEYRATPYHLGIRFPRFTQWVSTIHPLDSFLFLVLSRKSHKKLGFIVFCHSLDCIVFWVIVAGRLFPLCTFSFPES